MIRYTTSIEGITFDQLEGFFVGWLNPISPETHWQLLHNSAHIVLAIDTETGEVIGFIHAISDGLLSAYIPLLEVLPMYQNRGIGKELVQRMLKELKRYYMIDLTCDPELQLFYQKCGMLRSTGMMIRNR